MARPSQDPCILLLRDLVAIDSVNPTLVPGASGEGAIAAAIAEHMRLLGLDVTVQEVAPGRPNVIGVLNGDHPGPSLMLCGHVDTVGVEGMRDPFDPRERDGRLFGRGSQDMKGGVAAMIDAPTPIQNVWATARLKAWWMPATIWPMNGSMAPRNASGVAARMVAPRSPVPDN